MKRIIVNGANGYVASHFVGELLAQGYRVVALVRDSSQYSAFDRMKDALAETNNEGITFDNLDVYSYSLLKEDFGISKDIMDDIFSKNVDYFHFAASLKYNLKSKDEIFETNLNGVENSVKVFLKHSKPGSRFFFISTAYSCGRFPGLFEEKFYDNEDISSFRNYYELSKRLAENYIKKHMDEDGLKANIVRLSQVVGNNKTGVTKTDYGIFDFARRVHNLANKYPNKTIKIRVDPGSTQNLIPIDSVVNYLIKAVDVQELPVIMNFVAKQAVKNDQIVKTICKLLPINIIQDKSLERADMNAIERMIAIGMSFTGAYSDTNILFDTKNLDKIILSDDNQITEQSLYNMLEYFINELTAKKKKNVAFTAVNDQG